MLLRGCNRNPKSPFEGRFLRFPWPLTSEMLNACSCKFCMNDVRVLVPVINAHPHLPKESVFDACCMTGQRRAAHLSKCAQTRQDTASYPGRVFTFRRCKDLDPHVLHGKLLDLRKQSVSKALGEGAASGEHDIRVQRLSEIKIRPVDGVDHNLMHAGVFKTDNLGVE